MVDKSLTSKLVSEMRRVRDELMPERIVGEHRGSRGATAQLEIIRKALDEATGALAEQDADRCLEAFGELKGLT